MLTYSYLCNMNWNIVHIEETDSTNQWLKDYVARQEQGLEASAANIVVVARNQIAGRGCGTNTWESEPGKNLTFSMLIHPESLPANRQFYISEVTSVAICEMLENYLHRRVEVKWPNDIYVGDKKICGMLIENTLQGNSIKNSIIGIGVNVNQQVFRSDAPNPVSMWQLTGHEAALEELMKAFLLAFETVLSRKTASNDYWERLYRRTGQHEFRDKAGLFLAEISRIHPDGRLVLKDDKGQERCYAFKEVQFELR